MGEIYNPGDLLKGRNETTLDRLGIQQDSEVDKLLKSYGIYSESMGEDFLQKSHSGLVQKHITVHAKNGKQFNAVRWVSPETGSSPQIFHSKYKIESEIPGETDEAKISGIVNHPSMKPVDKQRHLISMGIYDKHHLDELSETKYQDSQHYLKNEAGIHNWKDYSTIGSTLPTVKPPHSLDLGNKDVQLHSVSEIQDKFGRKEATKYQKSLASELIKKYGITVDDKWDGYENDVNMLLDGELGLRAVMAYGNGGVGKSFVLENKILPGRKMIEYDPELDMEKGGDEYDYVKIGGKIGSRETQRYMYEHRNKVLIFDDCDSMWNDDGLINVLKNVLDTTGNGRCQWAQTLPERSKGSGDDVPATFKFSGRMIFITNLTKDELAEKGASPITESRAASTDLTMNMKQTLEKMEKIAEHIILKDENREEMPDVTIEDKLAGLAALKEVAHVGKIEQLNTRVLTGVIANARRMRRTTGKYDHTGLVKIALKQFGIG